MRQPTLGPLGRAYLQARATSGWTTRGSTWLAIAGFACVVMNFGGVNIFFVVLRSLLRDLIGGAALYRATALGLRRLPADLGVG